MINWQDTGLPNPATFSLQHLASTIRRRMDSGHTLQRSRFTKDFETARISFDLGPGEFRVWKGVWKHLLTNGVDWLNMDLPVGGLDVLTPSKVRFISEYRHRYLQFDNVRITVSIEFFEVETISEGDLALIISGIEPTVPYTTEGVAYIFQQIEGEIPYAKITETSTGAYSATSSTTQDLTQSTPSTATFDAMLTTGEIGFRIDAWSCVSDSDNTPAGLLYTMDVVNPTGTEPHLLNVDLRKSPSLKEVILDDATQMSTFRGTLGSSDRTFDLQNRKFLNKVIIEDAPILTTINIEHPDTVDTLTPLSLELRDLYGVTSLNLSGWFFDLEIWDMTALSGVLDLSGIEAANDVSSWNIRNNNILTTISLPIGELYQLTAEQNPLLSTITSQGTDTISMKIVFIRNTIFSHDSLIVLIDAMLDPTDINNPFPDAVINFFGTPAASNITQPTIDAAAAKNITLSY